MDTVRTRTAAEYRVEMDKIFAHRRHPERPMRFEGAVLTSVAVSYTHLFGVAAVLLMLLYHGQRGSGHKRLFSWFYPAHVYLLYGASCLVYNVLR